MTRVQLRTAVTSCSAFVLLVQRKHWFSTGSAAFQAQADTQSGTPAGTAAESSKPQLGCVARWSAALVGGLHGQDAGCTLTRPWLMCLWRSVASASRTHRSCSSKRVASKQRLQTGMDVTSRLAVCPEGLRTQQESSTGAAAVTPLTLLLFFSSQFSWDVKW